MADETAVTSRERPATEGKPAWGAGNGAGQPAGSPETKDAPPQNPGKRVVGGIVAVVVVIAGLYFGVRYYNFARTHVSTDDAYVTGNLVNISPIIGGTLSTLNVDEGSIVTKGQLIARLDDSSERASLRQAQAAYRAALSQIPEAQTSLSFQQATTKAAIEKAMAAMGTQNAKTGAARAQIVLTRATVFNQQEQARQQVAAARAQAAQADDAATALAAGVRSAEQAVQTALSAVASAKANADSAQANFAKAQADDQRYQRLVTQQAVTQQQYDVAHAAFLTSQAQVTAANAQVAEAQSQVQQARVVVQQASAQAEAGRSAAAASHRQVEVAEAGLALAQANATQIGIQQNNFVSNQTQVTQAMADLANAQAGQQQVTLKRQDIDTLQAQVQQARAAVANAQVAEDDTYIYAPSSGEVVRKGAEVGAALAPGQTIATMTFGNDVWVEANLKETQMDGVRAGEPVEISVDAFPDKVFKGRVDSINETTGSSIALLPPDNATGNFTKVVQRISVKILFVPAGPGEPSNYATADDISNLRQGMSVTPAIEIKHP
ncbi:MAG: HlyD family secretion protein [Capsulimonadaceae bacterium]